MCGNSRTQIRLIYQTQNDVVVRTRLRKSACSDRPYICPDRHVFSEKKKKKKICRRWRSRMHVHMHHIHSRLLIIHVVEIQSKMKEAGNDSSLWIARCNVEGNQLVLRKASWQLAACIDGVIMEVNNPKAKSRPSE